MTDAPLTPSVDLLVVDDDDEYRSTVVRRFARRGYRISEACNGEHALQLVQQRQFDVALIDMVMPGMSGIELIEKLKASQAECEVLLLTGQGTIESAVQAMKLGAFDYLTKPCPLAELELVIRKACEHRRLAKEGSQWKQVAQRAKANL